MELVLELLLTLFVAVVFSFLIANLISFVSAADDRQPSEPTSSKDLDATEFLAPELTFEEECRFRGTESQNTDRLVLQGVHEEVRQFEKIESVNKIESSISRDELVQEQTRESAATTTDVDVLSVKRFVVGSLEKSTDIEVEVKGLIFEENIDRKDFIESDETAKENLISMVSTRFDESGDFGELKAVNSLAEEDKILENVEADDRIGNEEVDDTRYEEAVEVKSDQNHGSETTEKELDQGGDERNHEWIDGNEDDWEGVEQSKLQKVFDQASKFVAGMGEDVWGNDLHMQLYGLHKVALEGPCQEPQPMALKLSARSKWVESCYM